MKVEAKNKTNITKEAEAFLRNPRMLDIWKHEIHLSGVVGESKNIKTLIVILGGGRLVINTKPTSNNVILECASGLGKTHVVRGVVSCFPPDIVESIGRISNTALAYWKKKDWDGTILSLLDAPKSVINSDVVRTFLSQDLGHSVITQSGKADHLYLKGKPAVVVSTVYAELNPELSRRLPIIALDESDKQTERIHKEDARQAKNGYTHKSDMIKHIRIANEHLKRVRVVVPFADKILKIFPTATITRTTFGRVLDYIKFSAALHQKQRGRDDNDCVIATIKEDYEIVRQIINKMKLTDTTMSLNPSQRRLLEILRKEKPISEAVTTSGDMVKGFTVENLLNKEVPYHVIYTEQNLGINLNYLLSADLVCKAEKPILGQKPKQVWWAKELENTFFTLPELSTKSSKASKVIR
jgi:hypothetical protein